MQWWIYDMPLGIFAVAFRRGLLVNHNFSHQRSFGPKSPGIKQLVETTRLSRGCLEALYPATTFALKVVQVSAATTRMMLLRAFSTRTKRVTPAQVHRLQSIPLSRTTLSLKYTDKLLKIGEFRSQFYHSALSWLQSLPASPPSSASNMVCSEYSKKHCRSKLDLLVAIENKKASSIHNQSGIVRNGPLPIFNETVSPWTYMTSHDFPPLCPPKAEIIEAPAAAQGRLKAPEPRPWEEIGEKLQPRSRVMTSSH